MLILLIYLFATFSGKYPTYFVIGNMSGSPWKCVLFVCYKRLKGFWELLFLLQNVVNILLNGFSINGFILERER